MTEREGKDHPQAEGDMLPSLGHSAAIVNRWRCPNCGQMIFIEAGERLPDLCAYCRDMTTWQPVS